MSRQKRQLPAVHGRGGANVELGNHHAGSTWSLSLAKRLRFELRQSLPVGGPAVCSAKKYLPISMSNPSTWIRFRRKAVTAWTAPSSFSFCVNSGITAAFPWVTLSENMQYVSPRIWHVRFIFHTSESGDVFWPTLYTGWAKKQQPHFQSHYSGMLWPI